MEHSLKNGRLHQIHKHAVHRNTRNILAIIFEEMNFSDEKFFRLKKSLESSHKNPMHYTAKQSYDIFTKES